MPIDLAHWQRRLRAARRRREEHERHWQTYAWLHARAYAVAQAANDDESVTLPNGDQVRLGLIHANLEQTFAQLELTEPVVQAAAIDPSRALGPADVHAEALLAAALSDSIERSGLVQGREVADEVKRYAVICGHGVSFTGWQRVLDEEPVGYAERVELDAEGLLVPVLGEDGAPVLDPIPSGQALYEGCVDEAISPLALLFDPEATAISRARWIGDEQIVPLTALRADPRFALPEDLRGGTFARKDLYGEEEHSEYQVEDSARLIRLYERATRQLLYLLEVGQERAPGAATDDPRKRPATPDTDLVVVGRVTLPLRFDHPDDCPYNAYVPIPALEHPFGISQVEHTRLLAEEADKTRTRLANTVRQQKRIFVYDKRGAIDPETMQQVRTAPDFAWLGVDVNSDDPNALQRVLYELPLPKLDADLYGAEQAARSDVDRISGVSAVPMGGAETATEADNIMSIGGARTERKRRLMIAWLQSVVRTHKAFLAAWAPEGQVLLVRSADGLPMPMAYGRAAFAGRFDLRVAPGGEHFNVSPVELKGYIELTPLVQGVAQALGDPRMILRWLRYVMSKMGVRGVDDILGATLQPPGMPGMPGLMPPGMPPAGVDGQLRAERLVVGDQGPGQALRAGANFAMEGRAA